MPGPSEPHAFLREVARSHETVHERTLEHRWEVENGRVDAHDDFVHFQTAPAYAEWRASAEAQISAGLERVNANAEIARRIAVAENKLPARPNWERPVLSGATLDRATGLLTFGSDGAKALLVAEQATRAAAATGGDGPLSDDEMAKLDLVRSTVHRNGMRLAEHVNTLEKAALEEVCRLSGEPVSVYSSTWDALKISSYFDGVRTALRDWSAALDNPARLADPDRLSRTADEVVDQVRILLGEMPRAQSYARSSASSADAPMLNGGIELHTALMVREVGEQLVARIGAPTVTAVYRFADERPEPPGGVPNDKGSLLARMQADDHTAGDVWRKAAEDGMKVVATTGKLSAGDAKLVADRIADVHKGLQQWAAQFDRVAADGPAAVHSLANDITLNLRVIDGQLAAAQLTDLTTTRIRGAIDAVHRKLRLDALAAVQLLS